MNSKKNGTYVAIGIDVGGEKKTVACILKKDATDVSIQFIRIKAIDEFKKDFDKIAIPPGRPVRIVVLDAPLTYGSDSSTGSRSLERDPKLATSKMPNYWSHRDKGNVLKPNSFIGLGRAIALARYFSTKKFMLAETHPGVVLKQLLNREQTSYKKTKKGRQDLAKELSKLTGLFPNGLKLQPKQLESADHIDALLCALVGFAHITKETKECMLSKRVRVGRWQKSEKLFDSGGLYLDVGGEKPTSTTRRIAA